MKILWTVMEVIRSPPESPMYPSALSTLSRSPVSKSSILGMLSDIPIVIAGFVPHET
jgi:hypothetical protein